MWHKGESPCLYLGRLRFHELCLATDHTLRVIRGTSKASFVFKAIPRTVVLVPDFFFFGFHWSAPSVRCFAADFPYDNSVFRRRTCTSQLRAITMADDQATPSAPSAPSRKWIFAQHADNELHRVARIQTHDSPCRL